jgi:hypothetical protein
MLSQKVSIVVTPAKAGVQKFLNFLDSRFHGNDRKGRFRTFYERIKVGFYFVFSREKAGDFLQSS